jgi:hypothetical protein
MEAGQPFGKVVLVRWDESEYTDHVAPGPTLAAIKDAYDRRHAA